MLLGAEQWTYRDRGLNNHHVVCIIRVGNEAYFIHYTTIGTEIHFKINMSNLKHLTASIKDKNK